MLVLAWRWRRTMASAGFWLLLAGARAASAQQGSGAVVSSVSQVRLIVVVPPRLEPAPAIAAPLIWNARTGTGTASIRLSTNTAYRIIVRRATDGPAGAAGPRVWIRTDGAGSREVTTAEPVLVRRGIRADSTLLVPFRIEAGGGAGQPDVPPIGFDVVVEPTL
jgi:hypothetical protein